MMSVSFHRSQLKSSRLSWYVDTIVTSIAILVDTKEIVRNNVNQISTHWASNLKIDQPEPGVLYHTDIVNLLYCFVSQGLGTSEFTNLIG